MRWVPLVASPAGLKAVADTAHRTATPAQLRATAREEANGHTTTGPGVPCPPKPTRTGGSIQLSQTYRFHGNMTRHQPHLHRRVNHSILARITPRITRTRQLHYLCQHAIFGGQMAPFYPAIVGTKEESPCLGTFWYPPRPSVASEGPDAMTLPARGFWHIKACTWRERSTCRLRGGIVSKF